MAYSGYKIIHPTCWVAFCIRNFSQGLGEVFCIYIKHYILIGSYPLLFPLYMEGFIKEGFGYSDGKKYQL